MAPSSLLAESLDSLARPSLHYESSMLTLPLAHMMLKVLVSFLGLSCQCPERGLGLEWN